jgi:hypothetical protein
MGAANAEEGGGSDEQGPRAQNRVDGAVLLGRERGGGERARARGAAPTGWGPPVRERGRARGLAGPAWAKRLRRQGVRAVFLVPFFPEFIIVFILFSQFKFKFKLFKHVHQVKE